MIHTQPAWQHALQHAVCNPLELLELLELSPDNIPYTLVPHFNLRVPHSYIARMRKGDLHDPLLRQILAVTAEQQIMSGFMHDPVGDNGAQKIPGLLHKYQGRVLLIISNACAVHCRYCFRQHFDYSQAISLNNPSVLDYIQSDTSITEVIWSGGDPLSVLDHRLAALAQKLATIPHVQRLRIHTRFPIVLPERITDELIAWLVSTRLQPIIIVHANHPNELDETVGQALKQLARAGITLFNQSVLLKGVNDNASILIALSETLFHYHVTPYYLHMLDKVAGASHFAVPDTTALQLLEQMRVALPGYLVPQLVREIAGMPYKNPVFQESKVMPCPDFL